MKWVLVLASGYTNAPLKLEADCSYPAYILRHNEDEMGRVLLQSEGNATLFIDVLRSYVAAKKFKVHDFAVMLDHLHLLVTVNGDMSIEKAVQFIKGGFSYHRKGSWVITGEVWQKAFPKCGSLTKAVSRNIGSTLLRIL